MMIHLRCASRNFLNYLPTLRRLRYMTAELYKIQDMSAKGNSPLSAHLPCTCGENIAYAITGMRQR
eukprot:10749557-Heterocapsa_arctica.AAC.1